MPPAFSLDRIRFLAHRLGEKLWVRPLLICLLSVGAVFLAKMADGSEAADFLPEVSGDSLQSLLTVMASCMLVIATFAVASMVSAYASASTSATPRSFGLVLADDVSQNALSTFLGAFIFSVVALSAVSNGYFGNAARFCLFALTLAVFGGVVVVFVRWVDRIARLGRMSETIDKVERACAQALARRREAPRLGGAAVASAHGSGVPVHADRIGYVQHLDIARLQALAEDGRLRIRVEALPGVFAAPGRPLAWLVTESEASRPPDDDAVREAFVVGGDRKYPDDPRFGLVVLSEIAGRALSPAVNDPGTAIDIIGTLVRLLADFRPDAAAAEVRHDRVEVPALSVPDLFEDAFTAIARDGAGTLEVAIRLQKGLASLVATGDPALAAAARTQGRRALARARLAMRLPEDLAAVEAVAGSLSDDPR